MKLKTSNKSYLKSSALIISLSLASLTQGAVIAQWNFNDTGTGTEAQRFLFALGASGISSGVTASTLSVNGSHDFAGFNNVPSGDNDGYGFGGTAGGQNVIFLSRANYFNGSATPVPRPVGGVTTWGAGDAAGLRTTVANSTFSFTISADAITTITLDSITKRNSDGGPALLLQFQEAGAAVGTSPGGAAGDQTAFLNSAVVIGPGQSKTFTMNLNSGALNTDHIINGLELNGSVVPEPSTLILGSLGMLGILRRRRVQS